MNYNLSRYPNELIEDIMAVEEAYNDYMEDPDSTRKYTTLKSTIYDLSLTIKARRIEGIITPAEADEMNDYFWGLIYD